ncbi:MAG: nucleoside phosphorylase [Anaerolineae bacterium]
MDYPILEYDPTPTALIEPSQVLKPLDTMPERCVMCFFQKVIAQVCEGAEKVTDLGSEIGKNPVYALHVNGERIAVVHPGVGAPLSAGFMDELIALGVRKFVACGGAGVLNREIAVGHVVVPDSAVRDEGTSYHYLPPAREVSGSPEGVKAIVETLEEHGVPYIVGKTWTTDGLYRETPARIARRKAEGCITVEMEAAAFFAVAQFRGVSFGQLLYGGDDISGEAWDHRDWHRRADVRERLFWLAAEAVIRL